MPARVNVKDRTDQQGRAPERGVIRTALLIALLWGLMACQHAPVDGQVRPATVPHKPVTLPEVLAELEGFEPPHAVEGIEEVFALDEDQRTRFVQQLTAELAQERLPHDATFDYIESLLGDFQYDHRTLKARDALAHKAGNCMALAILSTALADAAGVEIGYRLIEEAPVLGLSNSVLISASHVQARLIHTSHRNDGRHFAYRRSSLTIDFFPDERHYSGRSLSRAEFVGMYYRNLAVDALIEGRYQRAHDYAYASLDHDPDSAEAVNLFAVLYRRIGHPEAAERLFQHGLARHEQTVTLLDNYRRLLTDQGREADAGKIFQRLEDLDVRDPIGWLMLGHEAMASDQYKLAQHYYQKAVHQAPFLHQAQFGLAMALLNRGQSRQSAAALQAALDSLYDESLQQVYKAKYRQRLM